MITNVLDLVCIGDILSPDGMIFPDGGRHLLDRNTLGLRQQLVYEDRHPEHERSEEYEETKLHVAKHCQETLRDEERKQHVNSNHNTLPVRSDLKRQYLARHKPPQWAPRPRECRHVRTYCSHNDTRIHFRDFTGIPIHSEFQRNRDRNNNLKTKNKTNKLD